VGKPTRAGGAGGEAIALGLGSFKLKFLGIWENWENGKSPNIVKGVGEVFNNKKRREGGRGTNGKKRK